MKRGCILTIAVYCLGAPYLAAGDVTINEIHYQPVDKTVPEEFVELHNRGKVPVDVSGWFFSSGISYTFEGGVTIEPGGYLVVARDPEFIRETYGLDEVVVGRDLARWIRIHRRHPLRFHSGPNAARFRHRWQ